MATLRMTGAAVLDTAIIAASAANNLVNAIGNGAKMLNASIDYAAYKQDLTIKADKVQFKDVLMRTKSIEIAQSRKVLDDYQAANPDQSELLKTIWSELETALA